jgi:DNA-binding transcriptional regulator GbsR (MarR family)
MTNTKKMTKKDYFNALLNIPEVGTNAELVAFIDHELELLERKSEKKSDNKKPTATQIENEKLKNAILEYMKPEVIYTIKEMLENIEECDGFSTPKMSSLLHSLAKEEKVERVEEKRKIYWKLV